MAVVLQRVALTCCRRVAVTFDYPRLSVHSGNFELADETWDPAGWSRGRTWCANPRHKYERVLRADTIQRAITRAIGTEKPPLVASRSRLSTASALRRGDIDQIEASARRRGTVYKISIPLESI